MFQIISKSKIVVISSLTSLVFGIGSNQQLIASEIAEDTTPNDNIPVFTIYADPIIFTGYQALITIEDGFSDRDYWKAVALESFNQLQSEVSAHVEEDVENQKAEVDKISGTPVVPNKQN
ncbi:MAG: hypothetical protein AAGB12_03925 [Pseudomonadota bacterium]